MIPVRLAQGGAAAGAALLCSVPPSGNVPMTARYLRNFKLRECWRITRGFALKAAATDGTLARELFFDDALPAAALERCLVRDRGKGPGPGPGFGLA